MALDSCPGKTLTRIVGIVLVRNEDRFVRRVVENITGFCDRIILADNASTDGTAAILRELAAADPGRREYHRLARPEQSHGLIADLAGTQTWVFGADGDEVYDPVRLQMFRSRILAGEFSAFWMVMGNVLNCTRLDFDAGGSAGRAEGYLSPPSRSITKLYNFAAIDRWDGPTPERLHGGSITFRPGFSAEMKHLLHETAPWEASPLRCLHLCFLRRSSAEPEGASVRDNIMELREARGFSRIWRWARRGLGRAASTSWKHDRYRRGALTEVDTEPFFPRLPE